MVKSPNHRMHLINSWNSSNLPAYRKQKSHPVRMGFCFAASFYFSSTTLYCAYYQYFVRFQLLLLPQRYEFSSKSNFQANHNKKGDELLRRVVVVATTKVRIFKQITTGSRKSTFRLLVVVATTKVRIFKQITTYSVLYLVWLGCCCYHKGTNFQANHNINCFHNFTI